MARTDNDTWDLASSVGATATMVAAARAQATNDPKPLINDPFARPLVEAVGIDLLTRMVRGELTLADLDDEQTRGVRRMTDNMAARTKFFDEFFLTATGGGNSRRDRDRRGHPAGGDPGRGPGCPRVPAALARGHRRLRDRPAGGDRVQDRRRWPGWAPNRPPIAGPSRSTCALTGRRPCARPDSTRIGPPRGSPRGCSAICHPMRRTACSITSPRCRRRAAGSPPRASPADDLDEEAIKERMKAVSARWREHGFDLDMTELIYFGDRNEAAEYLKSHGWEIIGRTNRELFADYGLEPLEADQPFGDVVYVSGILK